MAITNSTFDFWALWVCLPLLYREELWTIWCTLHVSRRTSPAKLAYRELKKRAVGAATGSFSVAIAAFSDSVAVVL